MSDVLVIGAGLFGLTFAERAAAAGRTVDIREARPHIGGNAWSTIDSGIEVHPYGAHIFHTNNDRVWAYANRFTRFTNYRHRVWALREGRVHPLPFSLATLSSVLGRYVTPAEAIGLLDRAAIDKPTNLEDKALASLGRVFYDTLVRDYTEKQWQTMPRDLPAETIARLPFRLTYDTDYFTDRYQGMPVDGYAAWLERMVDNPRITVHTDRPWDPADYDPSVLTVYTGPVDALHNHALGRLGWRTVDFTLHRHPVTDHQGTAVINYADPTTPVTRSIEFRHFHPERIYPDGMTVVAEETSRWAGPRDEPYYPVNRPADRALLGRYRDLTARTFPGLHLGGRLGTYKYLDMHMAIGSALTLADRLFE